MNYKELVKVADSADGDIAYLQAVRDGDKAMAKRLFQERAKACGYTRKVYHVTDADFTVFDIDEESTAREEHTWMADYVSGTIFLSSKPISTYGHMVMDLLINPKDIKVFKVDNAVRAMDDELAYEVYNYPIVEVRQSGLSLYATLWNNAIKSADVVTYDDAGGVIPLSKRFDRKNVDIRY